MFLFVRFQIHLAITVERPTIGINIINSLANEADTTALDGRPRSGEEGSAVTRSKCKQGAKHPWKGNLERGRAESIHRKGVLAVQTCDNLSCIYDYKKFESYGIEVGNALPCQYSGSYPEVLRRRISTLPNLDGIRH